MAQSPIKRFTAVDDIYPTTSACERERARWAKVRQTFRSTYGTDPSHIVRAPGRVNVLGEHVDYSLLPVVPAAIEQDILIAVSASPSTTGQPEVQISNTSSKYAPGKFNLAKNESGIWSVAEDLGSSWIAYAKASIAEIISSSSVEPVSMKWLVDGVIPEGAGLSSSAAFTVAAVLASLVANERTEGVTQGDIVKLALKSEHRLGLFNGGMDQSASVFCLPGQLLHLSFFPELSSKSLPLPSSLALVITNSLEPHALSESAPERYNLRVFEILCAVRLIVNSWKVEPCDGALPLLSPNGGRVWMKEALAYLERKHSLSEEEACRQIRGDLERVLGSEGRDEKGWTKEEIVAASGLKPEVFEETITKSLVVRAERFHLYKRARHTIEESLRVLEFERSCKLASIREADDEALRGLGNLINASHMSLKDDYSCTVASVDQLQKLCLECGSLGSRQTGGGWGGAVVSLVPTSKLDGFLSGIKAQYPAYQGLKEEDLNSAVFATAPGCGAGVLRVSEGVLA